MYHGLGGRRRTFYAEIGAFRLHLTKSTGLKTRHDGRKEQGTVPPRS
jgi:hypothetical protein